MAAQATSETSSRKRFRLDPWLVCAALLALIPILTVIRPGMPNTADGQVHLLRALEASRLLREGALYPRWAPDFYLGYGYPFFNFYAPGAHLLVSTLALAGLGLLRGMVAAQVLALLLYPTGAYLAAKALLTGVGTRGDCFAGSQAPRATVAGPARTCPEGRRRGNNGAWETRCTAKAVAPAALLCAALYLYAPLRWRELFTQGNLSQLLALALLPWCAWALTHAARGASLRWAAGGGALLALLVYLHHPSALLAFPSLAVYALAVAVIAGRARRVAATPPQIPNASPLALGGGEPFPASETPAAVRLSGAAPPGPPHSQDSEGSPSVALGPVMESNQEPRSRLWRGISAVAGAFCVGILLSAPFWLPSLAEQRYVNIGNIEQGMFNARLNLLSPGELLSPARLLDDAALNPPMPNALGIAQALLALAGLLTAVLWVRGTRRRSRNEGVVEPGAAAQIAEWSTRRAGLALLVVAALLVVSLLVMLPVAAGAWEALPLARLIAFPWRMLGPALLWAALLGGAGLFLAPVRWRTPALLVLLVLAPLSIAPYLFPRAFAPAGEPGLADIARYEMRGGARGTASANEYLPAWITDPDPPADMAAEIAAGAVPDRLDRTSLPAGAAAETLRQAPLEDAFRLTLPAAAMVRIRRFYFPGWRAWVDGQAAAVVPGGPYGLIEVPVPAGTHEIRLRHGATAPQQAGGALALLGLALAAVLAWLGRRAPKPLPVETVPAPDDGAGTTSALAAAATILALTAVLLLLVGPHTRLFRLRSSAEAPAGMEAPLHARFANGIELIGYSLSRPAARQGETVSARLYWRALEPQAWDVRPFLHLDSITGDVTWANQTKLHAGDKPSSGWPAGFYVVDDYRLQIPADAPAVVGNLTAGLLDARGDRVALADGRDLAVLGPLRVRERVPLDPNTLPGRDQTYRLGPAVRLAGASAVITGTPPLLDLTLYWQAAAPVPADYTAFVHVLDAAGVKIAQADGPPLNGRYPSSMWEMGQTVTDRRQIALPAGVDPAEVRVAVGLYTPADGVRAPVTDAQGTRQPEDRILLSPAPGQ